MKKRAVKRPAHRQPVIIGWKEVIQLPDWGIHNLLVKVDTGAKCSAIDVRAIEHLENDRVRFTVALSRKQVALTHTIEADIVSVSRVRSSNGHVQERIKVETTLKIGRRSKRVVFSLVDRNSMICRAILGREALAPEFLVDSEQKYLHGPRAKPLIKPA